MNRFLMQLTHVIYVSRQSVGADDDTTVVAVVGFDDDTPIGHHHHHHHRPRRRQVRSQLPNQNPIIMHTSTSMTAVEPSGIRIEYISSSPPSFSGRETLPASMLERDSISVWSILKQCIGMELSKITMPVVFNEPLSFLQRISEYLEYSQMIRRASDQSDPVKRMEYVAAFAVSSLAANWDRVAKPFNPLLGETFQLDRQEDLGFRIVCEQVSHHPPVTAFHADSADFVFTGSVYPKLKFWGRSVELQPKGIITLTLKKHNETYTWSNVNCSVHNLVMGKMYIEQQGVMEIVNHSNNLKCTLHFKPSSNWFGGRESFNHVQGTVTDAKKRTLSALYGTWTDFMASCSNSLFQEHVTAWGKEQKEQRKRSEQLISEGENGSNTIAVINGSTMLWKAKPRPNNSNQYYNFTSFALLLNELSESIEPNLAPTDSRLRPDIRYMEQGNWDMAASEKHRLEEKQRAKRKNTTESEWEPKWFRGGRHSLVSKEDTWHFTGDFWKNCWDRCDDLF